MVDNLEHCIICLKQMESGFLDDDGVCIDCEEMEHDDQSDDTEKWHDFDPYCRLPKSKAAPVLLAC